MKVTAYYFGNPFDGTELINIFQDTAFYGIYISYKGEPTKENFELVNSWSIEYHGSPVGRDLKTGYSPLPSSRDDEFYKKYRFTLEEAKSFAQDFLVKERLELLERYKQQIEDYLNAKN
jgi:hypothetical protein